MMRLLITCQTVTLFQTINVKYGYGFVTNVEVALIAERV